MLIALLVGALIGSIAGKIMGSHKKGCLVNVILGVLGSEVGQWLGGMLNISGGRLVSFALSVAGACLIILVGRILSK